MYGVSYGRLPLFKVCGGASPSCRRNPLALGRGGSQDTKALNPHTIELLKIAGVDYFVKKEVIDDTPDQYIKDLSHILS